MKGIIKKYLEGEATAAEQMQLLEWLRRKENRLIFNSYSLSWKESLDSDKLPDESQESWNKIQSVLLEKSYKQWQYSRKTQFFFRYAAVFFFVVILSGLLFYVIRSKPELLYTRVMAENGQISKVELPDGSQVWLNSGSEIIYSSLFASTNRNIQLSGEAYFNVSHNEQLPLVVNCGELQVKVLGTRFNVAAYKENNHVDVVLEEGSVELLDTKVESFNYRLKPGERAVFNTTEQKMTVSNVNTTKFTSWKAGIINIYDQSMEQVVKRLETRYNQRFMYSEDIKNLRYTFTIKNEPLDEIIQLMEKITPVKAVQNEDIIEFKMDMNKMRRSIDK